MLLINRLQRRGRTGPVRETPAKPLPPLELPSDPEIVAVLDREAELVDQK